MSQTLKQPFELAGVGLHTGVLTHVKVKPAAFSENKYFVRTDLPASLPIQCQLESVRQTVLSTELANETASIRTVEHLLAALAAMGVTHAGIEVDGPEIPLLDGSALPWVEAIQQTGVMPVADMPQNSQSKGFSLSEPIWVHEGDAFVAALPAPCLRFSYGIEFDLPAIGQQWYSWIPDGENFATEIAPARTFGLAHQVESLRQAGLIKGGSLDNALVCDASGWLNPPLRFPNEPVRHKILDLVGDLSLLGIFPVAHILAYKASHKLHIQLARLLAQTVQNLEPPKLP
jgi:UDP-3-O-[3-hydroxymyristoyl] N-acetylglucosamine deacetylase